MANRERSPVPEADRDSDERDAREDMRVSRPGPRRGRYLREEIIRRVRTCWRFLTLLRLYTAFGSWAALVLEPQYPRALRQVFMSFVVSPRCLTLRKSRLEQSSSTLLMMSSDCRWHGRDLFAVQPLRLSVRMLPRLNLSQFGALRTDLSVIGSIVDEITKDFTVFVVVTFYYKFEHFDRVYRNCYGRGPDGGPAIWSVAENLYRFNSVTNAWTQCGRGLDLSEVWREVLGVTMHLGQYTVLVKTVGDFSYDIDTFCYERSGDGLSWEKLPGDFPRLDRLPGGGLGFQHFGAEGVSIFDHSGTLHVAVASYTGCSLWKYSDDTVMWSLVRNFRNLIPNVHIERRVGYWACVRTPVSQFFGDYLHFGAYVPRTGGYEKRCRMLTYNLVTGQVENMSYNQAHVWLIEKESGGQSRLLQLE